MPFIVMVNASNYRVYKDILLSYLNRKIEVYTGFHFKHLVADFWFYEPESECITKEAISLFAGQCEGGY